MVGKALPGILSRVGRSSNNIAANMAMDTMMSSSGDEDMKAALNNAVNTMKGVGEPTSLSTPDSGSTYTTHPAKM